MMTLIKKNLVILIEKPILSILIILGVSGLIYLAVIGHIVLRFVLT